MAYYDKRRAVEDGRTVVDTYQRRDTRISMAVSKSHTTKKLGSESKFIYTWMGQDWLNTELSDHVGVSHQAVLDAFRGSGKLLGHVITRRPIG